MTASGWKEMTSTHHGNFFETIAEVTRVLLRNYDNNKGPQICPQSVGPHMLPVSIEFGGLSGHKCFNDKNFPAMHAGLPKWCAAHGVSWNSNS